MNRTLTKHILGVLSLSFCSAELLAHHSYAPYDIRNPIEIKGVAEEFIYRRPHPRLTLITEEGDHWEIEVPVMFWDRAGYAQDEIKPGDELTVLTWPHRTGRPDGAMSGFTKDGVFHSVHDRIGQAFANEAADRIDAGEELDSVLADMPEPGNGDGRARRQQE